MSKYIVTDGQLLTLARRHHALFERFSKGVYKDPEHVLECLQTIIEGRPLEKLPVVIKPKPLQVWKTIQIGDVTRAELVKGMVELDPLLKARDSVSEMILRMKVQKKSEEIMLVKASPEELGFQELPSAKMFLNKDFLAEWSNNHLEGHELMLCPEETAGQLCIQHPDVPQSSYTVGGSPIIVAMEPIPGYKGIPMVFRVYRNGADRYEFQGMAVRPDDRCDSVPYVFRLRKIAA